jgi:hypothetical protein
MLCALIRGGDRRPRKEGSMSNGQDPRVFTYLTLRKSVGVIAFALPFAVAIPIFIARHVLENSISGYYYTGARNLFVGSLCAVAMFQFSCRGFDWRDEVAGIFSAICAVGVAFFPTAPENPSSYQKHIGEVHYTFAALLFLTLAYFCLVLFKIQSDSPTPKKLQRNGVYTASGIVILLSLLAIAITKICDLEYSILGLGPVFFFEATSLLAFGAAWLTKGETILKDV